MKKLVFVVLSLLSLPCLCLPYARAAGSLEEGMEELATAIVKNSMAQEKHSIAVAAFPHTDGSYSELSNYLSDELILKLFTVPESNLKIMERGQLNKIFQEMNFTMSGAVSKETMRQLGELHGVEALVLGTITEMGETIRVNARLTDTQTGRVFSAAATTVAKTSTISDLLQKSLETGGTTGRTIAGGGSPAKGTLVKNGKKSGKKGKNFYAFDFDQYEIGDIPEGLGKITIAPGSNSKTAKAIKSIEGGSLDLPLPFALHNEFEIHFEGYQLGCPVYHNGSVEEEFRLTGEQNAAVWTFFRGYTDSKYKCGENGAWTKGRSPGCTDRINKYTISGKGKAVKLFINGNFIGSQIRSSDAVYTNFSITMINQDAEITKIECIQK